MTPFSPSRWILLLLTLSLLTSCDSSVDSGDDKQVRLTIIPASGGYVERDTAWTILRTATHLIHFDKRNYLGVDSIVLAVALSSYHGEPLASLDLFNVTDNVPINGSELSVRNEEVTWLESGNLYNALPAKEIELAIRLKTSELGKDAAVWGAMLLMYRK